MEILDVCERNSGQQQRRRCSLPQHPTWTTFRHCVDLGAGSAVYIVSRPPPLPTVTMMVVVVG